MTEEDVAPPAEAPEEAGDGTEEAEAPAPQMTEFKVLVKSATKWWKSEEPEEGAEAKPKESIEASCAVTFLGKDAVESEACTCEGDAEELAFNFTAPFTIEEADEAALIPDVLNKGLSVSILDASKAVVGKAEVDLVALLEANATEMADSVEVEVTTGEEGAEKTTSTVSLEVSISRPLITEPALIGTLKGLTLTSLPESLKTAVQASEVTPDFFAAIELPVGDAVLKLDFKSFTLSDETITWADAPRFCVPLDSVPAFKRYVKKGLPKIELARYMPADMVDEVYKSYYFASEFSLKGLLEPGVQAASLACDAAEGVDALAILPPHEYNFEDKKARKYPEELPSAEEGEEGATSPSCVWVACGSKLTFDCALGYPLLKVWSLPKEDAGKLSELIPVKSTKPKKKEGLEMSKEAFMAQCKTIAKILVKDYGSAFEEDASPEEQKKVIFHLNKSGAYSKMKDFLKKGALEIVEHHLGSSILVKEMENHALLNEAFSMLLECVQETMKGLKTTDDTDMQEARDGKVFQKMKMLADEYEINGKRDIAERYYVERLDNAKGPILGLWHDYGTFCLRSGMVDKAEECFREELSINPDSIESLLVLASVMMFQSATPKGNGNLLANAEVLLHSATNKEEESGVLWALMALLYSKLYGAESEKTEFCMFKASKETKAIQLGPSTIQADGMSHLVYKLLDASLPTLALEALALCEGMAQVDKLLCEAHAHFLLGAYPLALERMESVMEESEADDVRPFLMQGKIFYKSGDFTNALHSFSRVMSMNIEAW